MRLLRSRQAASASQRGQAAIEFVLSLIFLIGMCAVLFQALHFELDVFNRSAIARYELFKEAREDAAETDPEEISEEIRGKDIGELVPYRIMGQNLDESLHYGPKQFRMKKGTNRWDPISGLHEFWQLAIPLALDHYEDSAGHIGDAFGAISPLLDALRF